MNTHSTWDHEEVFHDGDSYFSSLIHGIDQAKREIALESYIFEWDQLGRRVLRALFRARKRGVRVKLMVDGIGSSPWNHSRVKCLQERGLEVRVYNPLPWQRPPWVFWWPHWGRLNRRNHRKTCLIDETRAWIGGMNVTTKHLTSASGEKAWRDSSVKVEGKEGLKALHWAFDKAWRRAHFRKPPQSELVRLNATRLQRRKSYQELIQRITHATQSIILTTPYFVPRLSLSQALRTTAKRGVSVRILVPAQSDVWFMNWVNHAFYLFLLEGKVRIFEYKKTILHAKVTCIDDWSIVGSSNLNRRSFLHDLEADVVLTLPESRKQLRKQFEEDLTDSEEILRTRWKQRPWLERFLEKLAMIATRWV